MIGIFVFIYGLVIGSFLNVCIWRIPRGESLLWPGSHCPHCNQRLKAWDLVPILSWLFLKGKCRYCGAGIAWRYPGIELLNALLYLGVYAQWGWSPQLIPYLFFTSLLLVLAMIDWQEMIVPDRLLLAGVVFFFCYQLFWLFLPWSQALLGAGIGFSLLFLIMMVSRGGMGFGDVKLYALAGLFLGWQGVFLSLFLAAFLSSLWGIYLMVVKKRSRKTAIPFVPFIALGMFLDIVARDAIIFWYFSLWQI